MRLGGERRGDVVAAQIGPGAKNIIVGKNNIQIVFGERNLAVPIFAIALTLLAIAGILVYPYAKPRLFPEKMTGLTNIAVAEIGQIGPNGDVRSHVLGQVLRDSIYTSLDHELRQYFPDLMEQGKIQLRKDVGLIRGRSAEQRRQNAARLGGEGRRSINANLVVYGYITENEGEPELELEFYYQSATVRQEPDAVTGRYVLGQAIKFGGNPEEDPGLGAEEIAERLGARMRALTWITLGLIQDALDHHDRALEIFQTAERELREWNRTDGKGILHFFIGRQALFLRDYDLAIDQLETALNYNPDFANAQHTLGAVYFDMAQLYFGFTGGNVPPEQAICFSPEQVAQTKARFADEAEAWQTLATSEELLHSAANLAERLEWSHVEHIARLTLGLADQLEAGASLDRDGSPDQIAAKLDEAETQLEHALDGFTAVHHPQYIGWSHLGLALVQDTRADLIYRQNEAAFGEVSDKTLGVLQAMDARLTDAIEQYDACRAQKDQVVYDPYFKLKLIPCACDFYGQEARNYQQELRATMDTVRDQLAGR